MHHRYRHRRQHCCGRSDRETLCGPIEPSAAPRYLADGEEIEVATGIGREDQALAAFDPGRPPDPGTAEIAQAAGALAGEAERPQLVAS